MKSKLESDRNFKGATICSKQFPSIIRVRLKFLLSLKMYEKILFAYCNKSLGVTGAISYI